MPTDPDSIETVAMSRGASSRSSSSSDGRFLPGTLLASRYRIISLLGEGGMGEVFRADDLVLGQPVALKFLPESAKGNQSLLTRFYEEVRITRQISHANVCRVYDIGEAEGHPFLSMEYIDGEDLRGLLRRIGRLPADKALEFARKLCAGLSAAHARGILHRDLKPANIMIDARGEVRITDFGLAAVAEQLKGAEARHGTPAYMAPEQLEGREVTAQSDIYALGLVLYEMFTGKAAFQADTADEMLRKRQEIRLTNPSAVISDLDPAMERAILRCLDPDPKSRPASALDLARSLPGGDPLAAALAAGETPSPDMVAASGSTEALRPAVAVSLLAAVAALLVGVCLVRPAQVMLHQIPLENPPDVLAAKARDIARAVGYPERPVDSASRFTNETAYRDFAGKSTHGFEAWNRALAMPPSPVTFWYRQSPEAIVPDSIGGDVTFEDPVPAVPGMLGMILDSDGRLREFTAVPPQLDTSSGPSTAPDWSALFAAARLDMAQFKTAEPQWTPLAATDTRVAWTGMYPGRSDLPIRVEAAAFRGRAVYFRIVWPWTIPERVPITGATGNIILGFLALAVIAAAAVLARHNWKAGRGDRRGATRLALFSAPLPLLPWLLRAHHVAGPDEVGIFLRGLERAAFQATITWVVYLALEPWVRRYWPQALVVWSRVLAGRWRDPVVGRDVLCGALGGLALGFFPEVYRSVLIRLGDFQAVAPNAGYLMGARLAAADAVGNIGLALGLGLVALLALFLLRVLLRNQWLAAGALTLVIAVLNSVGSVHWILQFAAYVAMVGGIVVAGMRFGLFAGLAGLYVFILSNRVDTTSFTAWYGQGSAVVVILIGALALWGFRVSLGGQQVFTGAALEK